jgi:uncharacterized Tic20 family protein
MLKVEEMTQEQINQEIKKLDFQLTKLVIVAIGFILGFLTQITLIILGVMALDLISISILVVCVLAIVTNIKEGRAINLQLFILNLLKSNEDGE